MQKSGQPVIGPSVWKEAVSETAEIVAGPYIKILECEQSSASTGENLIHSILSPPTRSSKQDGDVQHRYVTASVLSAHLPAIFQQKQQQQQQQ